MGCCLSRVKLCAATHPSVRFLQALYVCRVLGAACSAVSDARLYGTNWAHPCHICARTRLTPAHICTKTGPAPATSAPGRGPPLPHWLRCDGKACDLTHGGNESAGICRVSRSGRIHSTPGTSPSLRPVCASGTWAHPCHISARTGPTPATSAPGLGPPLQICTGDWAHPLRHLHRGLGPPPASSAPGTGLTPEYSSVLPCCRASAAPRSANAPQIKSA